MLEAQPLLERVAAAHSRPLVFATLSGAHLYGFPSPDSDFDLRGIHLMSEADVFALDPPAETIESMDVVEGHEIDLVTHDVRKFMRLMLRPNGYVLEQLLSPLVVVTGHAHAELMDIGRRCVTRHHGHHYIGFARNQRAKLDREDPPRVKTLLYVLRVLMTGVHLMRTGEVEANLEVLNQTFKRPGVAELMAMKQSGQERQPVDPAELERQLREADRLAAELESAMAESALPERAEVRSELESLLLRLRTEGIRESPPNG
ncbi:MAG: nucleotidyltransferase domain-containing protein [Phycisphaerales bacterium]